MQQAASHKINAQSIDLCTKGVLAKLNPILTPMLWMLPLVCPLIKYNAWGIHVNVNSWWVALMPSLWIITYRPLSMRAQAETGENIATALSFTIVYEKSYQGLYKRTHLQGQAFCCKNNLPYFMGKHLFNPSKCIHLAIAREKTFLSHP